MPLIDRPDVLHFDYEETEADCHCRLCNDYRQAKAEYETIKALRAKHHRFCRCASCSTHRDLFVAYLAAANKREVYSELSYLLVSPPKPSRLAGECLNWVYTKIVDPAYHNTLWWALSSDRRMLRTWITDFQSEWGSQRGLPTHVWAVSGLC
jgi:hypothetical protein